MDKAFIFHGTGAGKYDHWFPSIAQKLEDEGVEVCRPEFPTPEGQNLENWLEVLDEQDLKIDQDTVLIGYSTGAVFILDILQEKDVEIVAAFLISGFTGKLHDERFDPLNKTFAERDFDFEKIKNSAGGFLVFHSESDPYVPLEKAAELAPKLDANLELVAGAGHFNTESGYTDFPELWKKLREFM
ncbi:MAG: RBBP9/YdeN family alpha/beta hydrolase [Candidatus Nanosalina sp.]